MQAFFNKFNKNLRKDTRVRGFLREKREQDLMRENLPVAGDEGTTESRPAGSIANADTTSTPAIQANKEQTSPTNDQTLEKAWENTKPVNLKIK